MLVAIGLSQLGNLGALVWYMPTAANQLFREFGLSVFLACVGLESGNHFFQSVATAEGVKIMMAGLIIAMLPVFTVALLSRLIGKMNFVTVAGLVAGAMSSTPTMIFATDITTSDSPAVTYASIAPLAMLTPVLCAQFLVAALVH